MSISDVEQLKVLLQKDAQIPSINPVRFINVDSMDLWVQVKAYLSSISERSLLLSDFCEEQDTAPNLNRLKYTIRTSCTSSLVVPLSEYLRINNLVAKRAINDILKANYENNPLGRLRIYIPLYRMKEILKDIDLDPRQQNCILYLDTNSDIDYSLTIVQGDLKVSIPGNQTWGYKEYLMYWEQNPDKPVIFHTKNAIQYKDIVFADDVTVIVSAYDLLRYHHHLPADIKQEFGTDHQWKELAQGHSQTSNLEDAICSLLHVNQFSVGLFESWSDSTSLKQWFLWLWAKCKRPSGYLGQILEASHTVEEFLELVYKAIIDFLDTPNFEQLAIQRRKLIADMRLAPSQSFLGSIASLDALDQIRCLTDLTQEEKRMVLLAYAKCSSSASAKDTLKTVYPDAYYYLAEVGVSKNEINNYFSTYKELKLTNETSSSFLGDVDTIAKENGSILWELDARNALVNKLYDDQTTILFVDALGVEYLSLLQHLFEGSCVYSVVSYIGRCNLPSTTEFNTDFLDGKDHEKFYKLDELKHSSNIDYPDNIIAEFNLMHVIKAKVDELLRKTPTVLLASDHGTSRMAVLYRNKAPVYQSKETAQLKKFGRYCIDTSNEYSDIDGCYHLNEYWIFANYSRFAEKGAPKCEIHGGASLEEVIVPVLRICRGEADSYRRSPVEITVLTPTINVSVSNSAVVLFSLSKAYPEVVALIADQRVPCEFSTGKYKFEFSAYSSGQVKVKLLSKGIQFGEFQVTIIRGIAKSDFDL